MRKIIVTLFLSLLLIGVGIYISVNMSPFKTDVVLQRAQTDNILTTEYFVANINNYITNGFIWDILDFQNFLSWLVVWSLGVIFLFSFFHLLIDKLFFRKFYEEPSLYNALRRGVFLNAILIGIIFLKLINGFFWYNILSIIVLFICLEIFILNIFKKKKPE